MKVGVLGLGLMGAPMALVLLRAGHDVVVWNRTPEKAAPLVAAGATAASSPALCVHRREVVVTMLADGPAVEDVLFGSGASASLEGALVIDTSSIPPGTARDHSRRLAEIGAAHLDAPVSGGTRAAAAGTLAIFAGGEADAFARARPVLDALGRATHIGPSGAGQVTKLVNQAVCGVTIGAVAEGLVLARAAGLDPGLVRDALSGGFAGSRVLDEHGARMVRRDFEPGAKSRIHLKDLDTALAFAAEIGVDLPFARVMRDLLRALVDRGSGDLDHSAVMLALDSRT